VQRYRKLLRMGREVTIESCGAKIAVRELFQRPRTIKKTGEDFAIVDASKLQFPLEVRNRLPGDRFWPLGQPKPSKLKDFLIRKKIPRHLRAMLALVFSEGELVWIAGVGLSEQVKVTRETRHFARLEMTSSAVRKGNKSFQLIHNNFVHN